MDKAIGLLCIVGGAAAGAGALGLVPLDATLLTHVPSSAVGAGGAVLVLVGILLLSRDHRTSDALASVFLLAIAAGAGWVTFYAPEGTLERAIPFIPASVGDELARLLFGLGAVACIGMAVLALRRLL
ncbi:MAG TPA: hypothetical protein VLS88_15210 [Polyangiales bacterium]|nr:hypothetical protein [Polyangiales bacterium]